MYTNVKVILNENIDQLYELCRKSFLKLTIAFVSLWAIAALSLFISTKYGSALVDAGLFDSVVGWLIVPIVLMAGILALCFISAWFLGSGSDSEAFELRPTKNLLRMISFVMQNVAHSFQEQFNFLQKIVNSNLTIQQILINGKEIICTDGDEK